MGRTRTVPSAAPVNQPFRFLSYGRTPVRRLLAGSCGLAMWLGIAARFGADLIAPARHDMGCGDVLFPLARMARAIHDRCRPASVAPSGLGFAEAPDPSV